MYWLAAAGALPAIVAVGGLIYCVSFGRKAGGHNRNEKILSG